MPSISRPSGLNLNLSRGMIACNGFHPWPSFIQPLTRSSARVENAFLEAGFGPANPHRKRRVAVERIRETIVLLLPRREEGGPQAALFARF